MQLRLESLAMPEPAATNSGQPLLLPFIRSAAHAEGAKLSEPLQT